MLSSPYLQSPVFDKNEKPPKRILLVDDDLLVRGCMRRYLEGQGYHCTEADNGAMALNTLANRTFSLIITDNQMPVMDGITFLETLYARQQGSTPVIIVTGRVTSSLTQRAHHIGITSIIEKPCTLGILSEAIVESIEA
ncbi:MAG: response regulator [Nitrospirales bacterium]|nr:response regulator [Nitrospira sp.]MDR4499948.1 response regulator [Nitrospirales bacterium]